MSSASVVEVVARFTAEEAGITRGVSHVSRLLGGLDRQSRGLRQGLVGMSSAFGSGSIAAVGLGFAVRSAIDSFEELSDQQATMRSILATNEVDMRMYGHVMEATASASRRFGYTQAEAAEGMNTLLETGVNAHEAMHWFTRGARMARVANIDLNRSQRVLVDSMRQFNMQTDEGADFLSAAFVVAGRGASTSIEELQQAARYASVEMSAMGYQADEVIAALAGMSAIGLRGTTAGTRMRGMIAAMLNPTASLRQQVEGLGQNFDDFQGILFDTESGALRPLRDSMTDLAGWFAQFGTAQQQQEVAFRMFGRRAVAAGEMMSQLHARGSDWMRIQDRLLGGQEALNDLMEESERERLRGFAHQMRQARASMQDFGRSFMESVMGPIGDSESGFGDYLRNLALATQYTDENQILNGETREEYQALSPRIREAGQRVRFFFTQVGTAVQWLKNLIEQAAIYTHDNPEFVAGFVAAGAALLTIIPRIPMMVTGLMSLIKAISTAWPTIVTIASAIASTTAFVVAASIAIVAFGLEISRFGATGIAMWSGYMAELTQADEATDRFLETWNVGFATWIPGVGGAIRLVGRFVWILQQMWRLIPGVSRARQATADANRDVAEMNAETSEFNEQSRQYAYQMKGRSASEGPSIAEEMGLAGRSGALAARATLLEQIQVETAARQREEEQFLEGRSTMMDFNREARGAGRAASNLASDLGDLLGPELPPGVSETAVSSFPVFEDAYVRRGGWLAASSGDMLVDRNSLAAAMGGPAGSMIPQLIGPSAVQQIGAMPQSTIPDGVGQTVDVTFEIPVQIDGREVARAVGRHQFQVGERRGRTGAPGERRRIHAEGVG